MENKEGNTGVERAAENYANKYSCPSLADRSDIIEHYKAGATEVLKKYASFEFEQWKKDHPEGFRIVKRAMEDYSNQQNAALIAALKEKDKSINQLIACIEAVRESYLVRQMPLNHYEWSRIQSAIERAKRLANP